MNLDLAAIVSRAQNSDFDEVEITAPEFSVRLRFSRGSSALHRPADGQAPRPTAAGRKAIRSPGMGRFVTRHPLHSSNSSTPTSSEATSDGIGEIVGFLMSNEMLVPVVSDVPRSMLVQLVTEGALVGYGDDIFEVTASMPLLDGAGRDQSSQ